MRNSELINEVNITRNKVKEALQIVYNTLNRGQQKQILKNEEVKKLFDLYEVEYNE